MIGRKEENTLLKNNQIIFVFRFHHNKMFIYKAIRLVAGGKTYFRNRVKIIAVIMNHDNANLPDYLSLPDKELDCKNNVVWSYVYNLEIVKKVFIKQKQNKIDELNENIKKLQKEIDVINLISFTNSETLDDSNKDTK